MEDSRNVITVIEKWENAKMPEEEPPAVKSHIFDNRVIWPLVARVSDLPNILNLAFFKASYIEEYRQPDIKLRNRCWPPLAKAGLRTKWSLMEEAGDPDIGVLNPSFNQGIRDKVQEEV